MKKVRALMKVWVYVLVGGVISAMGAEDTFTSISSMQSLVDTEEELILVLQNMIKEENDRLVQLIRYLSYMQEGHLDAVNDPENYVLNPLNAFHLIKRLTIYTQEIEELILRPVHKLKELNLPVFNDMGGAAEALCRLQDTYKLNASDLAKGIINGIKYSQPMSANDAWEIGRYMYTIEDYYHANLWFKVALELNGEELELEQPPLKPTNRSLILDFQAFSVYSLGHVKKAIHLTEQYLELMPNCARNKDNLEVYKERLVNGVQDAGEVVENERPANTFWDKKVQLKYEQLCRGEVEVNHKLVCRYTDVGNPYFRVGKVKMEEVNLDPQIVLFHDVIHDKEIIAIKELARPVITRSMVTNFSAEGQPKWRDKSRVSQNAFLAGSTHNVIAKVDQRAGMLANLDEKSSEQLQVLNYGIGGHYEPHFDYSDSEAPDRGFSDFLGNRIATLLYYMTDVEQGGATVFPDLGAAVFPRKGSAVLWYNLFRDGRGDPRTRHGACPVLIGSKWACNKWFHEGMQEFLRPCLLEQDSLRVLKPSPADQKGGGGERDARPNDISESASPGHDQAPRNDEQESAPGSGDVAAGSGESAGEDYDTVEHGGLGSIQECGIHDDSYIDEYDSILDY